MHDQSLEENSKLCSFFSTIWWLDFLKRIDKFIHECTFKNKKMKPRLKFISGLVLIGASRDIWVIMQARSPFWMQAEQVPIRCHLSRLLLPTDHSYKDVLQDPPKEELMYMPLHQEPGQTGVKAWPESRGEPGFGHVGQGIKKPGKPRPQGQPGLAWLQLAVA